MIEKKIKENNKSEGLPQEAFLQAWHSERDPNAGNERIEIPAIYKSFATRSAAQRSYVDVLSS